MLVAPCKTEDIKAVVDTYPLLAITSAKFKMISVIAGKHPK